MYITFAKILKLLCYSKLQFAFCLNLSLELSYALKMVFVDYRAILGIKVNPTFDAWRGQIVHKKHWWVKLTFGTRQRDIFHNIHVWCHSKTLSVILNFAFSTSEFNLNWTACIFTFRRTLNTFSYYFFTYRYPTS